MKPFRGVFRFPMFVLLAGFCLQGLLVAAPKRPSNRISYSEPVPVASPARMREWRYISIHHSGASTGNEEIIQEQHLQKGMENGMAYHFLIGNGSTGLGDGAVVEGHRWKYQLQGGHSHQEHLNECGIGICLVGNFNRRTPTARQIRSLAELVLELQQQFHIPDERVHGHGQFYGEDSDCPGRRFPWTNFWAEVDAVFRADGTGAATNAAPAVKPPIPR